MSRPKKVVDSFAEFVVWRGRKKSQSFTSQSFKGTARNTHISSRPTIYHHQHKSFLIFIGELYIGVIDREELV